MILKGNQRAGGMQLALHLLNASDNNHVEVHELSGFAITLEAGQGRFFKEDGLEVVSESYRNLLGKPVMKTMQPVHRVFSDNQIITAYTGQIACTNSSGTGRTCEATATVRAKSYPESCI